MKDEEERSKIDINCKEICHYPSSSRYVTPYLERYLEQKKQKHHV